MEAPAPSILQPTLHLVWIYADAAWLGCVVSLWKSKKKKGGANKDGVKDEQAKGMISCQEMGLRGHRLTQSERKRTFKNKISSLTLRTSVLLICDFIMSITTFHSLVWSHSICLGVLNNSGIKFKIKSCSVFSYNMTSGTLCLRDSCEFADFRALFDDF